MWGEKTFTTSFSWNICFQAYVSNVTMAESRLRIISLSSAEASSGSSVEKRPARKRGGKRENGDIRISSARGRRREREKCLLPFQRLTCVLNFLSRGSTRLISLSSGFVLFISTIKRAQADDRRQLANHLWQNANLPAYNKEIACKLLLVSFNPEMPLISLIFNFLLSGLKNVQATNKPALLHCFKVGVKYYGQRNHDNGNVILVNVGSNNEVVMRKKGCGFCPIIKDGINFCWDLQLFAYSRCPPGRSQHLDFRCLLRWNARIKWNFSGTNGQRLEVLHFFRSNRFELKLSLHLHQISFLPLVLTEA